MKSSMSSNEPLGFHLKGKEIIEVARKYKKQKNVKGLVSKFYECIEHDRFSESQAAVQMNAVEPHHEQLTPEDSPTHANTLKEYDTLSLNHRHNDDKPASYKNILKQLPAHIDKSMRLTTSRKQLNALVCLTFKLYSQQNWIKDNKTLQEEGRLYMRELATEWRILLAHDDVSLGIQSKETRVKIKSLLNDFQGRLYDSEWAKNTFFWNHDEWCEYATTDVNAKFRTPGFLESW